MTMSLPKFCDAPQAGDLVGALGAEFAVIHNPAYVHPPYELYALADRLSPPVPALVGVVSDMDGTTTTTEALCLHSLETMTRRLTGHPERTQWAGLSRERDYPYIIGNSTTKHVEYLVRAYGADFDPAAYFAALLEGAAWTILLGRDEGRREEARATLELSGLGAQLDTPAGRAVATDPTLERIAAWSAGAAAAWLARHTPTRPAEAELVRGAIEIYYARYHQILSAIARGEGDALAAQLLGGARRLIEPMPGVALFLAAIKGLLDEAEAAALFDAEAPAWLAAHSGSAVAATERLPQRRRAFLSAVRRFRGAPLRVAIVTSSIRYEAQIVLGEVFKVLGRQIAAWPLDGAAGERLAAALASPEAYYDAIITASDSSEIRLKPHRDLYSIALHRLGLAPAQFGAVLGLEDSESGVIAIRAAGIGLAVAVPFVDTMGHDLAAAAKVCRGGLPQLMFEEGFALAPGE